MGVQMNIWMTILGFISLSIVISIVTHCWIRYHLKNKAANLPPQSHTTPESQNNHSYARRQMFSNTLSELVG